MKRIFRFCIIASALLAAPVVQAVGYVNVPFSVGDNLFVNPLTSGQNNLLSEIMMAPDGTTVSLWNPASRSFDISSTFLGGHWSVDLSLPPGTGARLTTSTAFVNTFVGEPLGHDGGLLAGEPWPPPLPPLFSGPNGIYLLGDKCPITSSGNDVFLNILGRSPNLGEQFTRFDRSTQSYITSTYGAGGWDVLPSIGIAEAAFFNIGPVPEPSTFALLALPFGLKAIRYLRNRKQ